MKRRNFIQCIAALPIIGAVPIVAANITENKYAKYARFPVDISTTIHIDQPNTFIKIYTSQNKIVKYEKHAFKQRENYIHHYILNDNKTNWACWIPLDYKVNQKTKDEFMNELNKYGKEWNVFELIADNGKSNIYAVMVDGKNEEKAWGV